MDFPTTGFEDVEEPHKESTLGTLLWETNAMSIALEGK
jgi:hypothetical protein